MEWMSLSDGFKKGIERDMVVMQVVKRGVWRSSVWGDEVTLEYGKALRGYSQKKGTYRVFGSNGPIGWTSEALTQGPGVVLGRKGAYRGVEFCRDPFWVIDTAYYIVPKTDLDMRWLYYAVKYYKLGEVDDGSPIPSTTRAAVYMLELDVPPKHEQRAIAHILGTLDDKIELNRKQNETLEAMARAMFKAWFVDFEPVRAKMEGRWKRGQSLPGMPAHLYDLFPDRMVESEFGEIPEGWEVGNFTDIVDIVGGGTPKTSVSEYWGGGIPWFSVVDTPVSSDVFVTNTERSITKLGLIDSSARLVEQGTTIISARGTVGNLAIAGVDMAFNQSCYALQARQGCWKYFVFLSARRLVEQLKAMSHGSVFSTITRQTFMAVRLVLPPIKLVCEFERCSSAIFVNILNNVEMSRSLGVQRDVLIPYLVSGRLRVSAELND